MDTAMRIECASNPVFCVHMNLLETRCASRLRWIGSVFKLDSIINHGSYEVTPTMRSLAWLFSWLVARVILLFSVLLLQ